MLAAGSPPQEKFLARGRKRSVGGEPAKNTKVCKCGNCADCTQRAAVKKREAMERKARYRAAKIAAGDHSEQAKNTKARQKKRMANKAAGDHSDQAKNTKARQKKRAANKAAGDHSAPKTGIQP